MHSLMGLVIIISAVLLIMVNIIIIPLPTPPAQGLYLGFTIPTGNSNSSSTTVNSTNNSDNSTCSSIAHISANPKDPMTPPSPTISQKDFEKFKQTVLNDSRVQQWIEASNGNYSFFLGYGYTGIVMHKNNSSNNNTNDSNNATSHVYYSFSCPTFSLRVFHKGIGSTFRTANNTHTLNVNAVDIEARVDIDHNRVTNVYAEPVINVDEHDGILTSSNNLFKNRFVILSIVGGVIGSAAAFVFIKSVRKT